MQLLPVIGSTVHVAYLDIGASGGRVSVYLGGLGSASTVAFAPVVGHPAVAGRSRHVLVDLVGSGWSDHDDEFAYTIEEHAAVVAAVLDAQRLRMSTVVGHSLGGSIAISLATQRPDLVAELIVAEPNLDPGVGTTSAQIAAFDEDEFVATGFQSIIDEQCTTMYARTLRRWSPRGLHRTAVSLLAARPVSFRDQLTQASIPKRYLSGELTGEDLGALRLTGCDVRVVPDAAHAMMDDNLDGFVEAFVDSFEGVSA